jgi:hypothetical protein
LRASRSVDVATQPQLAAIIYRAEFRLDWAPVVEQSLIITPQRVLVMRSVKAIATLASAAAIVCSIFAFGWVGLALLGF